MAKPESNLSVGRLYGKIGELVYASQQDGRVIVRRRAALPPKSIPRRQANQTRFPGHSNATTLLQSDNPKEPSRASSGQMWAGIAMMTLIAGVLIYFGWWTKAALAMGVGIAIVVLAQILPDQTDGWFPSLLCAQGAF
jgi:hypothetical protein